MAKPNFLFLIADDHRFSALGALGIENISTPIFDKLMEDGTTFTRAHIMGSTSGAVCMPSRGMLMTGRNLFQTTDPLPHDTPLLPEWLWQNGYTTFGTGKWHNRPETFARSFSTGGKVFFGGMTDDQFAITYNEFDPSRAYDEQAIKTADVFSTTLFVDETIDFLNEHQPDDEPFFAYCAFTSPHDPRTAPEPYASMYKPDEIELPPNYMTEHPFDLGNHDIRDEVLAAQPRDDAEVRQHIADYYGMISHMDYEIGRVLQVLEDKGLADNTIVIYTADHGLSVGQHGLLGKQNLYDHSIRIPMIIRGTGIEGGKRTDAMCYLFDLFPTICEWAGVPLPETNEGQSLNTLLSGTTDSHRHSIFAAYQNIFGHPQGEPYQRTVKGERFKLIQSYLDGNVTTHLFDLVADPYETHDLHDDREYLHVLTRLGERLSSWQSVVNDPVLDN